MTVASPEEIKTALRRVEIMSRLQDHYTESLEYFNEDQIVGIFLQGSQNYGLDMPTSDVDTKLIVVPNFKDICLNKKPVSTTHVRANDEHTDWKDIRLYIETFRKQNLNFLEILFTPYLILNPLYEEEWKRLIAAREFIARMNQHRAVKSMKGIAMEKYHAMEHRYPSKIEILDKYGYDCKQLHHLARIDDYLERYIAGESYEDCLIPKPDIHKYLMDIKTNKYSLEEARAMATEHLCHTTRIADEFCATHTDYEEGWIQELLEDVSANIMRIAVQEELK